MGFDTIEINLDFSKFFRMKKHYSHVFIDAESVFLFVTEHPRLALTVFQKLILIWTQP